MRFSAAVMMGMVGAAMWTTPASESPPRDAVAKALGVPQVESWGEIYRAVDPARGLIGFAAAATARWEGGGVAEVAVLLASDGRIAQAASLAPVGKEQGAALAGLRRKTLEDVRSLTESHAAGTVPRALLDAARESVEKIYRTWGVSDAASVAALRKAGRMPPAPDSRYETLAGLMDAMMANYRSAWPQLKAGHFGLVEAAAEHLAALASQVPAHGPRVNRHRKAEFDAEAEKMRRAALRLAETLRRLPDRAAASRGLLDIYNACQSCHDVFAPAETADKRKYAPEM